MRSPRFSVMVFIASLGLALGACNSKTNPNAPSNGNGPDVPGHNPSVYAPSPPPSTNIEIRGGSNQMTPTGRSVEFSLVEFRPGLNGTVQTGMDAGVRASIRTLDGQPCDCKIYYEAIPVNSPADAAAGVFMRKPSFWSGIAGRMISEPSQTIPNISRATEPVVVPYVLVRIWVLQGTGAMLSDSTPVHATLVSDRVNWGG